MKITSDFVLLADFITSDDLFRARNVTALMFKHKINAHLTIILVNYSSDESFSEIANMFSIILNWFCAESFFCLFKQMSDLTELNSKDFKLFESKDELSTSVMFSLHWKKECDRKSENESDSHTMSLLHWTCQNMNHYHQKLHDKKHQLQDQKTAVQNQEKILQVWQNYIDDNIKNINFTCSYSFEELWAKKYKLHEKKALLTQKEHHLNSNSEQYDLTHLSSSDMFLCLNSSNYILDRNLNSAQHKLLSDLFSWSHQILSELNLYDQSIF